MRTDVRRRHLAAGAAAFLLITDGNPNTCRTLDPQCGQDLVILATQVAYQEGVRTLSIDIGDIVANPYSGCDGSNARFGADHLQDVANAGAGQLVMEPPEGHIYLPCVAVPKWNDTDSIPQRRRGRANPRNGARPTNRRWEACRRRRHRSMVWGAPGSPAPGSATWPGPEKGS